VTQPVSSVSAATDSAVARGSNAQLTDEAAAVDATDASLFTVVSYRQKYCTWPPEGSTQSRDFRPVNVGRVQRQNDLRSPSREELDRTSSRPVVLRSSENVSTEKPEVAIKPPTPRRQGEQQPFVEPETVSLTVAANEDVEPTSGPHGSRSLPRMSVTAFWDETKLN